MRYRLTWFLICLPALGLTLRQVGAWGADAGGPADAPMAAGGAGNAPPRASAAADGSAAAANARRYDFPLGGRAIVAPEAPAKADSYGWYGLSDPLGLGRALADPFLLGNPEATAWNALWNNYYRRYYHDRGYHHDEARHGAGHSARPSIMGGFIPSHIEFGIVAADGFHRTGVVDASGNPDTSQTLLSAAQDRPAPSVPSAAPTVGAAPSAERAAVAELSKGPGARPAAPSRLPPPEAPRLATSADLVSNSTASAERPVVSPSGILPKASAAPPDRPPPSAAAQTPTSTSSPREQAMALLQKLLLQREAAAGQAGLGEASAAAAGPPAPVSSPDERRRAIVARITAKIPARKPIAVAVQGDTATIRGAVASAHDRLLAEVMLRLEPGITQVDNQLTVEP